MQSKQLGEQILFRDLTNSPASLSVDNYNPHYAKLSFIAHKNPTKLLEILASIGLVIDDSI